MSVDGKHRCPWPGCQERVPRSMWGCRPHWYALPAAIRNRISRGWRGRVADHMAALDAADEWIEANT